MLRPLLIVLVAALAACGGGGDGAASDRLAVLHGAQPVADAFDRDAGHARLVLLLSPT